MGCQVASSEFKKLFLRLQGDPTWREEPWWKMRNLTTLYKVSRKEGFAQGASAVCPAAAPAGSAAFAAAAAACSRLSCARRSA